VRLAALDDLPLGVDLDLGALAVLHDLGLVDDLSILVSFLAKLLDLAALGLAVQCLLDGCRQLGHGH
jgi:hypothetical protein